MGLLVQGETEAPRVSPEMVTGGAIRKCFPYLTSGLHKGWGEGGLRLREVNQLY